MDMLMIVFRSSLKERVHEILRSSGVMAYTEFPETVGHWTIGINGRGVVLCREEQCDSGLARIRLNGIRSPARSRPGAQRRSTQVGSNQLFEYFLGLARSSYSRMIKRPLFGLSGLSSLSGFWLGETYQMNQINQTDRPSFSKSDVFSILPETCCRIPL